MTTERRYTVVRNEQGHYSIWPEGRELPGGWHLEGVSGTEQECADHIDRVWTDLYPAALRARRG